MMHMANPRQAKWWLGISTAALALSGLFSLLVVLPRTPVVQALIPIQDFFHTALVLHVDLSVLVWMLALAALLMSAVLPSLYNIPNRFASGLGMLAMLLFAVSPFIGANLPLMNNYVPVLQNPVFFLGLSCIFLAITLQWLQHFLSWILKRPDYTNLTQPVLSLGFLWMAITAALFMSVRMLNAPAIAPLLSPELYYEHLFWGAGHILQFLYTQMMGIAWLILLKALGVNLSARLTNFLFAVNALFGIGALAIYIIEPIEMHGYGDYFTMHMRYLGGLVPFCFTLIVGYFAFTTPVLKAESRRNRNYLLASLLLFSLGGMLGYLIFGHNVVIPAHYHGSIVGVTLALMGLACYFIEPLGLNVSAVTSKMAQRIPIIYATGQAMHIIGLAWSGGYGALRKTPGAVASSKAQLAMGLMGTGGLIAIISGLLFVIVMVKAFRRP